MTNSQVIYRRCFNFRGHTGVESDGRWIANFKERYKAVMAKELTRLLRADTKENPQKSWYKSQ
jgi:hypothetical protein